MYKGKKYPYHPNLNTARAIELPLAMEVMERFKDKRILEVGNVLSNHFEGMTHAVVDKYAGPIKEDIVDYKAPPYDLVISISTIEHIGVDEHRYAGYPVEAEPTKALKALGAMRGLVAREGELFYTWPMRYNPGLDFWTLLHSGFFSFYDISFMKRVSRSNSWEEAGWEDAYEAKYNKPFPRANVIVIARWKNV